MLAPSTATRGPSSLPALTPSLVPSLTPSLAPPLARSEPPAGPPFTSSAYPPTKAPPAPELLRGLSPTDMVGKNTSHGPQLGPRRTRRVRERWLQRAPARRQPARAL